ncbi:type IV pilus assembly protein PilE [Variovorax sp. YR750]|uniref:type IV pilin protein n=1 Tax=Variovorax sp. YR750 TaxID=1884384 RepID=UPI0008D4172E|nr:type IV pilin protein [Variovorax sp. YR750]SEK68267.1 type IV pilus assembly protein PilE [Variovorax sp. YR750]
MSAARKRAGGFTLIEVMITVVIIAILSAIAYPSYREQIAKGKRAQVKASLSQAQQWLERHYSENYSYAKAANGTDVNQDGGAFKTQFGTSPLPGEGAANYNIALTPTGKGTGYTLKATRTGSMNGDRCGDYVVTSTGRKSVENYTGFNAALAAASECWN